MKNSIGGSPKLKIGLPYNPTTPLLGIHAKKNKKDTAQCS